MREEGFFRNGRSLQVFLERMVDRGGRGMV